MRGRGLELHHPGAPFQAWPFCDYFSPLVFPIEMFCTRCPAGWQQFAKTCYYFSTEKKSWIEARAACSMLGAQLAIVNSELENVSCSAPQKQPQKTPNPQMELV